MEPWPARKPLRLASFSYRTPGSYFVTSCCAQRRPLFEHDPVKRVVEQCWEDLPNHFPTVELDEFVVMLNHARDQHPL